MPYHIARSEGCPTSRPWAVIKTATGEVMGCNDSEDAAHRHMAAMMAAEGEHMTLERQVAQVVAFAVKSAIAPLLERIAVLEARAPIPGPQGERGADGRDGKDGAPGLNGKDGRDGLDGKDGAAGLNGKDGANGLNGKDGANGVDGKDGINGKDGADGLSGKDGADGRDGADGINGKDGVPGLNGKDGADGKDGAAGLNGKDGRDGLDGKDGAPGLNGKDGIGLSDGVIARDGHLILTFSDGRTKDVGVVVGKDGAPGLNGKDGAKGLDGKDGAPGLNGKDGAPGLGFDDLDVAFTETDGYCLKFERGEQRKVRRLPIPYDAKVWDASKTYLRGAGVTYKGAWWIAQEDTRVQPGIGTPESERAWRLAVKGGRDGKPGRDGRDLTHDQPQ